MYCLCRNTGPVPGESTLQFGHKNDVLEGHYAQEFNPEEEAKVDNLVVVMLSDDDAKAWGRRFDVAQVKKIRQGEGGRNVFLVQYFVSNETPPPRSLNLDSLAFRGYEVRQLTGRWKLGQQRGEVSSDDMMCYAWIHKYGKKAGHVSDETIDNIEIELDRMMEM